MSHRLAAVLVVALAGLPLSPSRAQGAPPSVTVHIHVTSEVTSVADAIVVSGAAGAQTDAMGNAVLHLSPGPTLIVARRLGMTPDSARFMGRAGLDTSITFSLRPQAAAITPVIVSSTRTERRVEDEPLRVEVLAGEDVGEKTQMRPADLRVMLSEMPGVRVQTTSPSLGATSLRVQGLRGRYTQILTDGLPLYGASAGSFGLLQIPPIDLRQAEVIKGAASALYGPGAMGGVLNLVSRRPPDSSEALVNQTTQQGTDVVGFAARLLQPAVGLTAVAGLHAQRAVDVDHDGWSDIAGFRRAELRPRMFASDSNGRALMVTAGGFVEDRGGGSVAGDPLLASTFPESVTTCHLDLGGTYRARVSETTSIAARVAGNVQQRTRQFGLRRETEQSSNAFAELTSTIASGAHTLLVGVSEQLERYRNTEVARFDEDRATPALFVQQTYTPAQWLSTQLNGRCDASSRYGTICTPRLSVLAHSGRAMSVRLSGGAGWAAPTVLNEETEVFGLTPVVGPLSLAAERSRTLSLDISSVQGPVEVSGTLFASRVTDPVGLRRVPGDTTGAVALVNASGPARAHGAELFAVYNEEPFIVTAFYAATRTQETSPETGLLRESPNVPRSAAGADIAFEEDESGTRVGVELFYTGRQALEDNPYRQISQPYLTLGVLASQQIGRANFYLNLENLTNVRQTRWDPLLRPTPGEGGRRTVDEWAPLEGRTINAGVQVQL